MNKFYQYPYPVKFLDKFFEENTYNLCKVFIEKYKTVLSLSFGKDSMTILHIISKYDLLGKLELVMFNNSGFEANETLLFRDHVIKKYNIKNYDETFIENYKEYFEKDLNENLNKKNVGINFVYNVLEKPRWEMMDKYKINGSIIGLRKEESKIRKINYLRKGINYYNKREQSQILQPIVNWKILDIFSYAYTENIPIHPVYQRAKKLKLDYKKIRVNNLSDINCYQYGRIQINKLLYPDEYNKIINEFLILRRLI
jgi:3'-phosphoadenosine 5'-phosphosulfate sulfotransferase (PAPS reductase)/FAD synthetase